MDYSSIATGAEDTEHGEEECLKRDDPNANIPSAKKLARDTNNNINVDLIKLSEDLEAFNNYSWGYESFKMTVQYLLTSLTPKRFNLYGFPWAFMIVHPWLVPTNRKLKMPFFLTLRFLQTLLDPKVIDGIKIELFGATTITRKIILEGGLLAVDNASRSGSGSGAAVRANDALLTVVETTNNYDYDHTGYTDFSSDFATCSECSVCKCQDCKAKYDGVINALTASIKEMTSNRGVIPSKRISYPYTPLEIKATKERGKDTFKASSSIKKTLTILAFQMDVTVEATTEEHNITVDNPSTTSKDEEKVEPISFEKWKNYPFGRFNILDEAPIKLTQLINAYSEWIVDGLLKHHAGSDRSMTRVGMNAIPTPCKCNGSIEVVVDPVSSFIHP
ncbi:hypothetical protein FXO37_01321 [Capsicum annuum]|nr:hypothetical protein FXO37_01321 [Capsicum annuum]